ncbi:hypothetical protein NX059_003255 [Plenodomus lindquistii]|nr:hypothetical protein NX059_003255 [Plenodomus lindquistii]
MPDNNSRDYYADLGLQPGASVPEIKTAFHALAKQHHPDKTGVTDSTIFRKAREAFEKLTDNEFRAKYDMSHRPRRSAAPTAADAADEDVHEPSRTEQYAAAEEARRRSPPPYKPKRKSQEPSWAYFNGKAYTSWAKKQQAWEARHPEQQWYEEQEQQYVRP